MDKKDILKKLQQVGARGAHYQFGQLREALGLDTSGGHKNERANIYNFHNSLVKDEVIEEIPGERKRNRYYRIKNEERLKHMMYGSAPSQAPSNGTPKTLPAALSSRLESALSSLQRLEDKIDHLDDKMTQLLGLWS